MLRGQKRKIPEIIVPINASLHNRFDIEIIDTITGKVKQRVQAENVICTALWTKIFTPATYFNYIHYGTGSGTPASSNTSLFSFLGYKTPSNSDNVYISDVQNEYVSLTKKAILNPEDNAGSTITEVGIAYGTSSTNLCTHAMLKDMNGNEISIVKTSTDLINIYATVFVHISKNGYSSESIFTTFNPSTIFYRFLLGNESSIGISKMVPIIGLTSNGGVPVSSDSSINFNSVITVTPGYNSTLKTITLTASRVSASLWNSMEILGVLLCNSVYQTRSVNDRSIILSSISGNWYPEASITGEAVGTGDGLTTKFATVFSLSDNATIYIDGNAVPEVTVLKRPKSTSNMEMYFIGIDENSTDGSLIPKIETKTLSKLNSYSPLLDIGETCIYYNPYYNIGVSQYTVQAYSSGSPNYITAYSKVYISDDLITWIELNWSTAGVKTVPSEYQHYKYWKLVNDISTVSGSIHTLVPLDSFDGYNIIFDIPPASGSVITADYTTKAIAKDANHVFDVSVVITLGEYTS